MGISQGSKSRLSVRQGKMTLSSPALPELGCLVASLDETGCTGQIFFEYISIEVANAWRNFLEANKDNTSNLPLRVSIDIPPFLNQFEVAVQVVTMSGNPNQLEINLNFHALSSLEKAVLHEAVLALATNKIRKGTKNEIPKPEELLDEKNASDGLQNTIKGSSPTRLPPNVNGVTPLKFKKVGEVLVHMGQMTDVQLQVHLKAAQVRGERLGHYLVRKNIVSSTVLCRALALQSGLPMTDLSDGIIAKNAAFKFTITILKRFQFVPFDETKQLICIATSNPLRPSAIKELEALCGKKLEIFLAEEEKVLLLISQMEYSPLINKERKHIRYKASIIVKYQFCNRLGRAAETVVHQGVTLNLSEGGMLIDGPPSTLGSPDDLRRRGMCVRIILPHDSGPDIQAVCQMRSIRENEKASGSDVRWLIGVELAEISAIDRRRLKEVCLKAATTLQKKLGRQKFSD